MRLRTWVHNIRTQLLVLFHYLLCYKFSNCFLQFKITQIVTKVWLLAEIIQKQEPSVTKYNIHTHKQLDMCTYIYIYIYIYIYYDITNDNVKFGIL